MFNVQVFPLYILGSNQNTRHKVPKRVQVAKKEELLGEDTNRIDQAEYKLQSMISPETHDANRFFNRPPSKEIGDLRVDTLSPAQVSFIQSSTQWHKYFKPSSPSRVPSNIFPDDPVLFPGMKSIKGSDSEAQGYIGGALEGSENPPLPKHRQTSYDSWNSYGSYGDTSEGTDQRNKDYEEPPFTDKSWMNSKSEGRPPGEGYESFDGKSLAVPELKQDEPSEQPGHFDSQSQEQELLGDGGVGLGHIRHSPRLLQDQKARLLEKLDALKDNAVMPQEGEEKVFFNGENRKLLSQSDVESPPLLGPSGGLGTALAEELLQKNKGKFQKMEDSTEIIQSRSGTNGLDELELVPRPLFDERASQRTLMYNPVNDYDRDMGHVVLIRSHKVKDNPKKILVNRHTANAIDKRKHKDIINQNRLHKSKMNVQDGSVHRQQDLKAKRITSEKSFSSTKTKLCKRCSFPLR